MNVPITRLFLLVMGLFAVLVFQTSRWTVFGADRLRDEPLNRRALLEDQKIRRGLIRAADGTVLARSVHAQGDTFARRYPTSTLFAHAVGYSFTDLGRTGLERTRNSDLTGDRDELSSILDQLRGKRREGDDVITNLDPAAQRIALDGVRSAQGAGRGSVVAIEPATGKVRVLASLPSYDPNGLDRSFRLLRRDPDAPLLDRATQAGYVPGSTFKVVTAAAALDSGAFTPDSMLNGKSPIEISGVPLSNFSGEQFGDITLTTALTHSVNTVWAQVGEKLGKQVMARYMRRFGFQAKPPLDLPGSERAASGPFSNGRLLSPLSSKVDVGRTAIGQDKLRVTPLQMAMVAAAVANGGVLMKPRLTDRIVDRDGRTRDDVEPERESRVMSADSAAKLAAMMTQVVKEGTGTAAALSGIDVAGKTGTAEIGDGLNQVWFIGFAPAVRPRIAIAVTVERSSGQGGTVAAPIAKRVMEALLKP